MDQESFERSTLASRPEEVRELLHLGSSRPCSRRDYVRMLMQRGTSLLTLNRKSKDMAALVKYARELTDNKNGRDEILIECVSLNTSFFAELNLDIAFPRSPPALEYMSAPD